MIIPAADPSSVTSGLFCQSCQISAAVLLADTSTAKTAVITVTGVCCSALAGLIECDVAGIIVRGAMRLLTDVNGIHAKGWAHTYVFGSA